MYTSETSLISRILYLPTHYVHCIYCYIWPQEQYVFIHDAILEAVTCGDTQISASDLRRNIQKLSRRDQETRSTGFESQFKASHQSSCCAHTNTHIHKQTLPVPAPVSTLPLAYTGSGAGVPQPE